MKYKLIVSDIDGVWTDGSFYYSETGDTLRRFTTKDSYGVKLCQLMDLPILILSTEDNLMVQKRMEKLNIKYLRLGLRNKLNQLKKFCDQKEIDLSEVAYIGDDMNDYHLLGQVGYFACPKDAYSVIRQKANKILGSKGGDGAFREFVEHILETEGILDHAYDKYKELCLES